MITIQKIIGIVLQKKPCRIFLIGGQNSVLAENGHSRMTEKCPAHLPTPVKFTT
jgi:hypothetical protein